MVEVVRLSLLTGSSKGTDGPRALPEPKASFSRSASTAEPEDKPSSPSGPINANVTIHKRPCAASLPHHRFPAHRNAPRPILKAIF